MSYFALTNDTFDAEELLRILDNWGKLKEVIDTIVCNDKYLAITLDILVTYHNNLFSEEQNQED